MQKIALLGSSGLLGSWFKKSLSYKKLQIVCLGRSSTNDCIVDLTDEESLLNALNKILPDIIVNFAAEANVDFCEKNPHAAFIANVKIPKNLNSYLSRDSNCKIVHISTDHIYDGEGAKTENQITVKNTYALTKLAGEYCLSQRAFIIRTNFFGRSISSKDSFSDWIVKSFNSENRFSLFKDSYFSPVHWSTLVEVIESCMLSEEFGTYNIGSINGLSKADFALEIARQLNLKNSNYDIIESGQVLGRAIRPTNMVMNSNLALKKLNVTIGSLEDEISKLKKEYAL